MSGVDKIVLAYSGGLDTSIILKWLKQAYDCEVIALTADLGQEEELEDIEDKALATGALKARVQDVRREFARDFVFPALRAGAVYEGRYLLGTSLARPLISKQMVQVAREEGAQAIAHGATGKGNDQVRFELAAMALDPDMRVIAPWREWELGSRSDLLAFAEKNGITVPGGGGAPYSCDRNLMHISFEGGELEDPWQEPGPGTYLLTRPPEDAPDKPEIVEIGFQAGDPVSVNGESLSPEELLRHLNQIGGRHGIGRVDMVENRFVGMKSRGVYETPGGTLLHAARRDLEGLCMDREAMHLRDAQIPEYARMVYNGFWYSPERRCLQEMIDSAVQRVAGTVRLKCYKGQAHPVGRSSPNSLYDPKLATFEEGEGYDQADAAGFIRLQGLRLRAGSNLAPGSYTSG